MTSPTSGLGPGTELAGKVALVTGAGRNIGRAIAQALATAVRQRAAEQSIDSDPSVRAMREVFGATVKPGSIKPLN